jgi:hypothetical protein
MNNIHLYIIGSEIFFNLLKELDLNYKISQDKYYKRNNQNLPVRIIFVEKLKLLQVKNFFLENVPTIFLLNDKNFFKKNNLHLLDFHVSLSTPIDILSFKEILNILITKYSFLKKSKIVINNYELDSNQRVIMKNNIKIKLTEKELELILTLNRNNGVDKSFLLKNIWNHNTNLESHAFETHLHRLRKKISKSFQDKKFITEKKSLYYISK